ncbi:hypothetical protein D9758_017781 [Tetrapyrgos nigripes]|uniref:Endonuclease/exonuclease/phosphatase domain-containing protein n=1 Tax=Tetrapyrgos nigripes TaxID=182062 RepID=A0A8H5C7W9_9AGAR|nr:hypothetical protein D9758_017781 [Tetrapyrgos nigripes]
MHQNPHLQEGSNSSNDTSLSDIDVDPYLLGNSQSLNPTQTQYTCNSSGSVNMNNPTYSAPHQLESQQLLNNRDNIPRSQPENSQNMQFIIDNDYWWFPTQTTDPTQRSQRTSQFVQDEDGFLHYNPQAVQSQESAAEPSESEEPDHDPLPFQNDSTQGHSQAESYHQHESSQTPQMPRRERRRQERILKKNTKAAIRIASLNIRGYGHTNTTHPTHKWRHVNQIMRDKRIGILMVQEAHLTTERVTENEHLHKQLRIFHSSDPENPTGKAGVAIVLNRRLTSTSEVKIVEVIPGRALQITTNWHKQDKFTALTIYAPNVTENDGAENKQFWEKIKQFYEIHPRIPKPDIVAGDFNIVEAGGMDRLPARSDPEDALDALDNLKIMLNLKDGWRDTYPTTKMYTYPSTRRQSNTSSQSRLDRIYVKPTVLKTAREWKIEPNGVPNADHLMVSVQVTTANAPNIGKG